MAEQRMHLERIELNPVSKDYSTRAAYASRCQRCLVVLTAQEFKAEHNINAQPGACLVDQLCWGNYHGISYQYFRTEDTGYYYSTDHNYTTPWDFVRNDNAYQISNEVFSNTLSKFIQDVRKLYPKQPVLSLPHGDGRAS
ncbi:carbohydrate esterase family 2 protein [Rhizoctonia solani]|uniref:Carbohydrate esterase family 2 protein n=1 Tax=Rhizoctonia solani TaxID=456999 RepID=A0A8H8P8Q1_9AGAM|nr:carbohydrate esterase family 2 protein [Rhizoctonia solani]QRW25562.1 carbohydrate esterase family 2 protein [Rhizoctonia solani]